MRLGRVVLPLLVIVTLFAAGYVLSEGDRSSWRPPNEPPRPEVTPTKGVTDRDALLTLQKENDRLRAENAKLAADNAALRNSVARIADAAREAEEQRKREEAQRAAAAAAAATPSPDGGTDKSLKGLANVALARLRTAQTDDDALQASSDLAALMRDSKYPEGVTEALVDILQSDASAVRRRAAAGLLKAVDCDDRMLRTLARIVVRDSDETVRLGMIGVVGRWPAQRDVSPVLLYALGDSNAKVRIAILDLLPIELPDRFFERVLGTLRATEASVRIAAVRLLGRIRAPDGVDLSEILVQQMKTDRDREVRRASMDALVSRLGHDASPLLEPVLDDPAIGLDARDYLDIFTQGASLPISQIVEAKRSREEARAENRR